MLSHDVGLSQEIELVSARHRGWRLAVAGQALLVPIFLVYLWFPGDGDQTVFELGARQMADGAVYYRDFWDIKQPGIYWFYQLGLSLGVGVVGPRLLEIAGAAVAGVVVWRLAARWGLHPFVQVVSPALVLGTYLLLSHRAGVTQIEGLLNPWLLAVFALTWPARPGGAAARPIRRWALAGLAVGWIAVLKPIYLPIPAVLMLGALVVSRASASARLARLGAAAGAASLPVLAAVAYFAWNGALDLAWLSTITLPVETVQQTQLSDGWHRWKDLVIGPILPLAGLALLTARRRGTLVREITLALSGLVALGLAWPQFPGQYRMLMLAAPCGVLAMVGADVLWRWVVRSRPGVVRRRVTVLGIAAVLMAPMMWGPQRLLANASEIPSWGLAEDARNARDFVLLGEHHDLEVAPVSNQISPGTPIYVFGHPQIYEVVDAVPAVAISGWDVDSKPRRVWTELDRQLAEARPEWIYVENGYLDLIARRSPQVAKVVATRYRLAASVPRGAWYRTETPGQPCVIRCDTQFDSSDYVAPAESWGTLAEP